MVHLAKGGGSIERAVRSILAALDPPVTRA